MSWNGCSAEWPLDTFLKVAVSAIASSSFLSFSRLTGFFQALLQPVTSLHMFYSHVLLHPVSSLDLPLCCLPLTFKAITHQLLGTNIIQYLR